jgi:branched-chain amino acid transport system substrate-binding protein
MLAVADACAERQYGPGVSDTEIKIGQTMPYSGPASAFGTMGRAEAAYFQMVNDRGGVNGRKIRLLSLDDAYSPPRTVEQTRRLVEQEGVLLMFSSLGTATSMSVHRYLNARKVPQILTASVANKWNDPQNFPWSMAIPVPPRVEAGIYARYILQNHPNARIGVLYQNDDFGKDYLASFHQALNAAARMVVAEISYEVTDPTIDSQIVALKSSGADLLVSFTTPKFAAMSIRKVYDFGWKPVHIIPSPASSVAAVLLPAGLERSVGLISATALKDPTDPAWQTDPGVQSWLAWIKQYYPEGNVADSYNVSGYIYAQTLVHVLKQCGDDLSRDNVMRQVTSLKNVESTMLLPGIQLNNSATDFYPLKRMQMRRFDGKQWVRFGKVTGE